MAGNFGLQNRQNLIRRIGFRLGSNCHWRYPERRGYRFFGFHDRVRLLFFWFHRVQSGHNIPLQWWKPGLILMAGGSVDGTDNQIVLSRCRCWQCIICCRVKGTMEKPYLQLFQDTADSYWFDLATSVAMATFMNTDPLQLCRYLNCCPMFVKVKKWLIFRIFAVVAIYEPWRLNHE